MIRLRRDRDVPARVAQADRARQELTQRVIPRAASGADAAHEAGVLSDPLHLLRASYPLRALGLGLGFVCVSGTLYAQTAPASAWTALALHALAWPHLAHWLARRSADPRRAEYRNLAVDSLLGGTWVALIQLALLPGVVLLTMLSIGNVAVGGWSLMLRNLGIQAIGAGLTWLALGRPFTPEIPMSAVLAVLPMLVAYPMATAFAVHRLGLRVREQNQALRALNRRDALTGLGNRQSFAEHAASEYHRWERSGRAAAILIVDLDRFKSINDRHGHAVGDEVLRRVALAIRGCLREIDVAARLGGDEFAVILAETQVDHASLVAERIRAAISAQIFERAADLHCTASVGVAELSPSDDGVEAWFERADQALYRAKADGRNRARVAD